MKVKSDDRTVADILTAYYLRVPRFQRPYEWTNAEVEDFWDDVVQAEKDYFIGSMVVFPSTHGSQGVVDGQQRITTITILLCVIRDSLRAAHARDEADGLQNLIERASVLDNQKHFVLQTDEDSPFLRFVQAGQTAAEPVPQSYEVRLAAAYRKLKETVRNHVGTATPKAAVAKLVDLRDRVLGLRLIHVEVDNEDDATVIFQTLNSRGRDLEAADLVKSHLLSLLKTKNPAHDSARDRWNEIRTSLAESQSDIPMDRFLLHSWLSRRDYLAQADLGKEVRKNIKKAAAKQFLEDLQLDGRLYRQISEPAFRPGWQQEEFAIRDAFDALNIFRVRQPMPWILALWRKYESKTLKLKHISPAITDIERFHFLATAVASQPSSGGVSKMYATQAKQLTAATSLAECQKVISTLRTRLVDPGRLPTLDEFTAGFLEIRLSRTYTQQSRLALYVLRRLLDKSAASPPDMNQLTVEHIAPQSGVGTTVSAADAARLGNLLLVSNKLNQQLDSNPFAMKKPILEQAAKEGVAIDSDVLEASSWTSNEIVARTRSMAKLAYDTVWTLS